MSGHNYSRTLSKVLKKINGEDLTKTTKIGSKNHEIKIDFGVFLTLFASSTDIWQSAIGSFFNYLFQTKIFFLRNPLRVLYNHGLTIKIV